MAPNSTVKGGLSHSAQKKENAAGKKEVKVPKGPSGDKESKRVKMQCTICKGISQSGKELAMHFEARHPKETFVLETHGVPVA